MDTLDRLKRERESVKREQEAVLARLHRLNREIEAEESKPKVTYTFFLMPWGNSMFPTPGLWAYNNDYVPGNDGYNRLKAYEYRMPMFITLESCRQSAKSMSSGAWRYIIVEVHNNGNVEVIEQEDKLLI